MKCVFRPRWHLSLCAVCVFGMWSCFFCCVCPDRRISKFNFSLVRFFSANAAMLRIRCPISNIQPSCIIYTMYKELTYDTKNKVTNLDHLIHITYVHAWSKMFEKQKPSHNSRYLGITNYIHRSFQKLNGRAYSIGNSLH